MEKQGFKQREIDFIPHDWKSEVVDKDIAVSRGGSPRPIQNYLTKFANGVNWIKIGDTSAKSKYIISSEEKIIPEGVQYSRKVNIGDFILSNSMSFGRPYILRIEGCIHDGWLVLQDYQDAYDTEFLYYLLTSKYVYDQYIMKASGSSVLNLNKEIVKSVKLIKPPIKEQKAIATALSDVDALITSLEQTITKKKAIKQGAMQQLLTPPHKGGKRLPGFEGEWEYLPIELVADCLDNLRVPLNGEQRNKMNGDIPYCGANGVVDYVDDYVIDDDIILMAEDGGYFDEYKTRHIAYRMIGKCWVNNHAHILKAKKHINQGYLFYTLVHKNILDYINGGTRAKLNKSEMNKIESWFPSSQNEQKAIAQILSDMDAEITQLETKKEKYQAIKQGMMQELLTGKTRLI